MLFLLRSELLINNCKIKHSISFKDKWRESKLGISLRPNEIKKYFNQPKNFLFYLQIINLLFLPV